MSTSLPPDFNAQVIEEFRDNAGVVGGMFEGMTLLLLHDQGAKSGKPYIHPLVYHGEDGRYLIFASKGGAPRIRPGTTTSRRTRMRGSRSAPRRST